MQTIRLRPFQSLVMCTVVLVLLILITACSGIGGSSGQPTTSTTATSTAATQVRPTVTQPPAPTATLVPPTPTQPPVAFKVGGISFIGHVMSVNSGSFVMSAPNRQTFTIKISPQTDLSGFGGSLPAVGTSVDMDSAVNQDGSWTATILQPAQSGDPDLNVIAYIGITTSAVGTNRVIHFTVGTKSYTFTIPSTADLGDFGGNAQAIGNNVSVKVKVQFPAQTIVSVGNPNA